MAEKQRGGNLKLKFGIKFILCIEMTTREHLVLNGRVGGGGGVRGTGSRPPKEKSVLIDLDDRPSIYI